MTLATTGLAFRFYRTSVLRDANANETDAGGQPLPPDWQPHITSLPCRAWTSSITEPGESERVFVMEVRRAMVPAGTDVTEQDQLGDILRRDGTVYMAGPMNILGVQTYTDHLELNLEDVRS